MHTANKHPHRRVDYFRFQFTRDLVQRVDAAAESNEVCIFRENDDIPSQFHRSTRRTSPVSNGELFPVEIITSASGYESFIPDELCEKRLGFSHG